MKNIRKLMVLGAFMALGVSACAPLSKPIEIEEGDNIVYDNNEENLVKDLDKPDFIIKDEEDDEMNYPSKVKIHFISSNDISGKAFYVWAQGVGGKEYNPDSLGKTSQGKNEMVITLDFSQEAFLGFANKDRMFFIIKNKRQGNDENWGGQSEDTTLSYKDFPPNADGLTEVFCIPGEGNAIEIYESMEATNADRFLTFAFKDFNTLTVKCSAQPSSYELYAFDKGYLGLSDIYQTRRKSEFKLKSGSAPQGTTNSDGTFTFEIKLNLKAKINLKYLIEGNFPKDPNRKMQKIATFENLYNNQRFRQYYEYTGELGAIYSAEKTTFRVWAPTAHRMLLKIYNDGTPKALGGDNTCANYDMVYRPGGIWELTLKGDLHSKYYTYEVYNSLGQNEVVDPYAKACGVNGVRGEVLDFDKTDPTGWNTVPDKWDGVNEYDIVQPNDLSVYECHIRDLTMDESWVGKSKRGTYAAFSESNTRLASDNSITTGFDHVAGLGIKAVQLIPIYDQDNDETDMSFNWGYNPLNYNCLEGGYATNPYYGEARIYEFKNLVKAFADIKNVHTRIIMDVVYNHVSSAPASNFNKLMPRYYFRYTDEWAYYNGSGCGNEVKTEAPMMSKFIVESLCWWASEYKIKGFRFDLMGLIDFKTMIKAAQELYKIDPDIVLYGEGWTGDGQDAHIRNGEGQIDYGNWGSNTWTVYNKLSKNGNMCYIGGFNDCGRDALRGKNDNNWWDENGVEHKDPHPGYGYMQQGSDHASEENRYKLGYMFSGANINVENGKKPYQTVNYASCHDNYTVFDQLYWGLGSGDENGAGPSVKTVCDASVAAHTLIMASNGIAFMQGGEEIFRTKELDATARAQVTADTYSKFYNNRYVAHNSYNAPDSVNSFKWDRKVSINGTNTKSYYDYFKGMIKLHSLMNHSGVVYEGESSAGNTILGLSWSGKDKNNNNYNGGCGFQNDEYFAFLAGRSWAYVDFSDVPSCTKLFSFGTTSFDNVNKTVNIGDFDNNTGGSVIVFYRGKKM